MLKQQPKTERGRQTLKSLCDAAEKLFYQNGYHGTTVKDITQEAQIGVGTFYLYFNEKKGIYDYLLLQYSHFIRSHIAEEMEKSNVKNRREAEKIGLKAFLEVVRDNKHIYNVIWESLYIDKQLFIDYYTNFANHYITQIKKAQDKGEIKKYNPEVIAYMLMGISNFIGLRWTMFKPEDEFSDIVDEAIKILDNGIFC